MEGVRSHHGLLASDDRHGMATADPEVEMIRPVNEAGEVLVAGNTQAVSAMSVVTGMAGFCLLIQRVRTSFR